MAKKRISGIPHAPLQRIFLQAGATRVSADALTVYADMLEEIGEQISLRAIQIAKHAGRKTIHAEDIKIAAKK